MTAQLIASLESLSDRAQDLAGALPALGLQDAITRSAHKVVQDLNAKLAALEDDLAQAGPLPDSLDAARRREVLAG